MLDGEKRRHISHSRNPKTLHSPYIHTRGTNSGNSCTCASLVQNWDTIKIRKCFQDARERLLRWVATAHCIQMLTIIAPRVQSQDGNQSKDKTKALNNGKMSFSAFQRWLIASNMSVTTWLWTVHVNVIIPYTRLMALRMLSLTIQESLLTIYRSDSRFTPRQQWALFSSIKNLISQITMTWVTTPHCYSIRTLIFSR